MRQELTPEQEAVIRQVWRCRVETGDWPKLSVARHFIRKQGILVDVADVPGVAVWQRAGLHNAPEFVRLTFEGATMVEEGRKLFARLPDATHVAIDRFLATRDPWSLERPKVTKEDLSRLWPASAELCLVRDLLEWNTCPLGSRGGTDADFHFEPSARVLRYKNVETIEDIVDASSLDRPSIDDSLSSAHVRVLSALFDHFRMLLNWPVALEFVLECERSGGYTDSVVDLLEELEGTGLVESFNLNDRHSRLKMQKIALPLVDAGEVVRCLVVSVAREALKMHDESGGERLEITEEELIRRLGMPHRELAPAIWLISGTPFATSGWIPSDKHGWDITINASNLISLERCESFEDLAAAVKRFDPTLDLDGWATNGQRRNRDPSGNDETAEPIAVAVVRVRETEEGTIVEVKASKESQQFEIRFELSDSDVLSFGATRHRVLDIIREEGFAWITPGSDKWTVDLDSLVHALPRLASVPWLSGAVGAIPEHQAFPARSMDLMGTHIYIGPDNKLILHFSKAAVKGIQATGSLTNSSLVAFGDTPPPVRVFISYSWDSEIHRQRVLALAQELRRKGVDVNLDQFMTNPLEGWPQWMDRQLREAAYVLLVCSETYLRRYEGRELVGRGLGVRWESLIMANMLYGGGALNKKCIPVLFDDADPEHIPLPLQGATRYSLPLQMEGLVRHLTGQPEAVPVALGRRPILPPRGG